MNVEPTDCQRFTIVAAIFIIDLDGIENIAPAKRADLIADATDWICGTLVPRLSYRVMPLGEDPALNAQLFRLAATFTARRDAFQAVMTRTLAPATNAAITTGGYYLAATGVEPERQGFMTDVFAQLQESQNFIAWTPEGCAEERSLWRKAILGYLLLALFFAVLLFFGLLAALGDTIIRWNITANSLPSVNGG